MRSTALNQLFPNGPFSKIRESLDDFLFARDEAGLSEFLDWVTYHWAIFPNPKFQLFLDIAQFPSQFSTDHSENHIKNKAFLCFFNGLARFPNELFNCLKCRLPELTEKGGGERQKVYQDALWAQFFTLFNCWPFSSSYRVQPQLFCQVINEFGSFAGDAHFPESDPFNPDMDNQRQFQHFLEFAYPHLKFMELLGGETDSFLEIVEEFRHYQNSKEFHPFVNILLLILGKNFIWGHTRKKGENSLVRFDVSKKEKHIFVTRSLKTILGFSDLFDEVEELERAIGAFFITSPTQPEWDSFLSCFESVRQKVKSRVLPISFEAFKNGGKRESEFFNSLQFLEQEVNWIHFKAFKLNRELRASLEEMCELYLG